MMWSDFIKDDQGRGSSTRLEGIVTCFVCLSIACYATFEQLDTELILGALGIAAALSGTNYYFGRRFAAPPMIDTSNPQ